MSRQVSDIIALTQTLSIADQWQVVQSILARLEEFSNASKTAQTSPDILDDLNADQRKRLAQAIEESEAGNTIPHAQVQEEVKKWLTR